MDGSISDWFPWMAADLIGSHGWQQILLVLMDGSRSDWFSWMAADLIGSHGWQPI
jgi:hypothetical protein